MVSPGSRVVESRSNNVFREITKGVKKRTGEFRQVLSHQSL